MECPNFDVWLFRSHAWLSLPLPCHAGLGCRGAQVGCVPSVLGSNGNHDER